MSKVEKNKGPGYITSKYGSLFHWWQNILEVKNDVGKNMTQCLLNQYGTLES